MRTYLEKIIAIPKIDETRSKEILNKNGLVLFSEKKMNKKEETRIHIIKNPEKKIAKKLPTDREKCTIRVFIRDPFE